MKIDIEQLYLVSEVPQGIAITRADEEVKPSPLTQKLVMVDKEKLVDYLIAYLTEREKGLPLKEAHELAMDYVKITKVRDIGAAH